MTARPVGTMPFAEFAQHARAAAVEAPSPDGSSAHLRYFRFRGQPALERVRDQWSRPYFMPERIDGYAEDVIKRREEYPAFGVFHGIRSLEFDVHPGETLIIPHSSFHEVHTLSTSISLTYNLRDIPKVAAWMIKNRLFNPRALDVG
jgi:hypothetical protein